MSTLTHTYRQLDLKKKPLWTVTLKNFSQAIHIHNRGKNKKKKKATVWKELKLNPINANRK